MHTKMPHLRVKRFCATLDAATATVMPKQRAVARAGLVHTTCGTMQGEGGGREASLGQQWYTTLIQILYTWEHKGATIP